MFTATANEEIRVRINTIYWPGWNVFNDGKKIDLSYNNPKGVIEISLPKGVPHHVRAEFGETPLRLVADFLSIVSLGILLLIVFPFKKLK